MPILSERFGYLFLLAPRTGSTAVAEALCGDAAGRWIPPENILDRRGRIMVQKKHATARQLVRAGLLAKKDLAELTIFTTVRNPFDSLVSLYVKKRNTYQPLRQREDSFVNRIPGYSSDMDFVMNHTFSAWIERRYGLASRVPLLGIHLYRRYLRDAHDVMRFESLETDLQTIAARLGVGPLSLGQKNVTREREPGYRPYYTEKARRIVGKIFRPDLDRFGYRF